MSIGVLAKIKQQECQLDLKVDHFFLPHKNGGARTHKPMYKLIDL